MSAMWEKYASLFNARVLRERVIIALCLIAGVYFVWEFTLLRGLSEQRKALDARYNVAVTDMQKISAEEKVLSQALLNNPNSKKQREIVQLQSRLKSLDGEIEALSVGLVAAEKLPDILRQVLLTRSDLTLLGMQALEPENLRLVNRRAEEGDTAAEKNAVEENFADFNSPNKASSSNDEQEVGVFKHRVILRLRGHYFSIRDYLTTLEHSGWHFYWSGLDYVVDEYPMGIAQLEVYTLSTDKGFIGHAY